MLRVHDLCKSFGETEVLKSLSFEILPREKVLISASSGKGKTTLLRILCGLEHPDRGTVEGVLPSEISYCFQESRLFPGLTALRNVTCVLPDPKGGEPAARELLIALGLEDALGKYPNELSGGMKQRVALARALAADRPILLLDEPFTALDAERKESVRALVRSKTEDKTLILVSHDSQDGARLTQRTIFL